VFFDHRIRENITPRGDGNKWKTDNEWVKKCKKIRENITPRGDGNYTLHFHF